MVPLEMVILNFFYVSPTGDSIIITLGNPVGGLVFSSVFNSGKLQQLHEWTVRTAHLSPTYVTL